MKIKNVRVEDKGGGNIKKIKVILLMVVLFFVTACFDSPEIDSPLDEGTPNDETEETPQDPYDPPVDEDFIP